jgi:hypothetical protein
VTTVNLIPRNKGLNEKDRGVGPQVEGNTPRKCVAADDTRISMVCHFRSDDVNTFVPLNPWNGW